MQDVTYKVHQLVGAPVVDQSFNIKEAIYSQEDSSSDCRLSPMEAA